MERAQPVVVHAQLTALADWMQNIANQFSWCVCTLSFNGCSQLVDWSWFCGANIVFNVPPQKKKQHGGQIGEREKVCGMVI